MHTWIVSNWCTLESSVIDAHLNLFQYPVMKVVFCTRKQWKPLMGLELINDRFPVRHFTHCAKLPLSTLIWPKQITYKQHTSNKNSMFISMSLNTRLYVGHNVLNSNNKNHTLVNGNLITVPFALIAGLRSVSFPSWNNTIVGSCLENEEVFTLYLK